MLHKTTWKSGNPLDLAASVARYERWGRDPINRVEDGFFWRVLRHDGDLMAYRASQQPDGTITVEADDADAVAVAVANLSHRLSESLPFDAVEHLASRDTVIGELWRATPGYRPPLGEDPFESIVSSITAQQVNLTWAATTRRRLVERFGTVVSLNGKELLAFPAAATVAGADPAELRAMQFTTAKSEYIVGVARSVADGFLDGIEGLDDDAVVQRATELRGVGRWTADWLLARCLGRPRAVAGGDLGVRKAVGSIYLGLAELPTEQTVRDVTSEWGDAANWATHLLLEALSTTRTSRRT